MKKNIYYKDKILGEIIYKKNDKWVNELIEVIQKKYSLLQKFFDFEISPIIIHLLYYRIEVNKYWGAKTPNWICGFARGKNKIYILSPLVSKKISGHSKSNIHKVVIHEIVHLFIKKMNLNSLAWLNEGLALFLAKQIKNNSIKKANWNFLMKHHFLINSKFDLGRFGNKDGYKASYILVNFLFKNYKRDNIIKLIQINTKKGTTTKELEKILNVNRNEFIKKVEKNIKFL